MIEVKACFKSGERVPAPGFLDSPTLAGDTAALGAQLTSLMQWVQHNSATFVWLTVTRPNLEEVASLIGALDVPEQHLEDALDHGQRARIDLDGNYAFTVFKLLTYLEAGSDIETSQLGVFTGPGYIMSVSLDAELTFDEAIAELEVGTPTG